MTLSTALIRGRLTDLVGLAGVQATVTLQPIPMAGKALADDTTLRIGTLRRDTDTTGTLVIVLPKLPQAGYETYRWRVTIKPRGSRTKAASFDFTLTADTTWADAYRQVPMDPNELRRTVGYDEDGKPYYDPKGIVGGSTIGLDTDGVPYIDDTAKSLGVIVEDTDGVPCIVGLGDPIVVIPGTPTDPITGPVGPLRTVGQDVDEDGKTYYYYDPAGVPNGSTIGVDTDGSYYIDDTATATGVVREDSDGVPYIYIP